MTCKEYKDRSIVYHCKAHRKGDRYVCECGLDEPYTRTDWEDLTQEQRDKIMDNVGRNHLSTENHSGAHGVQSLELEEFKAIDESAPISKGQIGDFWEKVCEERARNSNHISNKPKNEFYLIFNPSQSAPKHRRYSFAEAQKEAKRIAKRHPEQTVYVLETVACYTAEVEIKEIKI